MVDFKRSLAVVIGINEYQDYPKLQTARYDAERLAEILVIEHKYDYVILVADHTYKEYRQGQELPVQNKYQPTLNGLLNLLSKRLPAEIKPTKEDRLVFYFAGHGIPDDSDEGPKGYLVPLDADSKKRDSLLPMQDLYKYLAALNCRHFLIILDCCFAGRFRGESARKGRTFPKVIHQEHYDRFIKYPAWQAITSASHDQEAFDILGDNRGTVAGTNHSPFAEGLFKALQGEADVFPAGKNGQPAGDGVITATELYQYLRDHVEIGSKERQTPGLWPLPKHDRGEYIFLVPGAELNLKPAPKVNEKNNPYRGLESFDEKHSRLFFGREELIEQLSERISAPKQPLTVVLGRSGSGKSSLVKAGLIPCLKKLSKSEIFEVNFVSAYILTLAVVQAFPLVSPKFLPINYVHQWHILNPMRPGESPFIALAKTILPLADVTDSNQPDTLDFIKVSTRLDTLTFITEVLKQKIDNLDEKIAESSLENGEESSETLRLKKEVEQFISIAKEWYQGTEKAKQLLIVEHFEELYTLCGNPTEQQQLQQAVSDCLDPLSSRLQSDPNQLINIVTAWSKKNPGVRLLLTIDQFEELITLSQSKQKDKQNQQQQQKKRSNQPTQEVQQPNKQEEWQQFLSLIEKTLSANLEQLRILVTLRSDFEPRFLNSDALKSYWTKARFPVRAMRSDELRQAIERPASEIALYFEPPTLVDKLIDEVGQMPGALPLLSFTLSELYIKLAQKWRIQETSDRALTLDADFDKEGGVAGSLTRRANQEYNGLLDDAHKDTLRRVMLRMVTFEGGELARRRVPLSELVYADAVENERVKLVLERFDRARLIVSGQETGEPYVEPAHDFLVRSWDKLQEWQQKEQEDLPLQRRLTPAALEWKSKQEARFLWNADPYLDVLKQVFKSEKDNWFNNIETEFVKRSIQRRERNRRTRWSLIAAAFSILSVFTFIQWKQNQEAQSINFAASSKTRFASAQQLDALVEVIKSGKTLKRVIGADAETTQNVVAALLQMVYSVKERNRWQGYQEFTFSSDGKTLILKAVDGQIKYWNLEGKEMSPPPGDNSFRFPLCRSGAPIDGGMSDSLNGKIRVQWNSHGLITISRLLYEQDKRQWQELWTVQAHRGRNDGYIRCVRFSPDGRMFASASVDKTIKLWSVEGKPIKGFQAHDSGVNSVRFSPDGKTLASAGEEKTIRIWNLEGKELKTLQGDSSDGKGVSSISFSPDGKTLASANDVGNRSITLWSLEGKEPKTFDVKNSTHDVSFSPDGKMLASASEDGSIKFWSPDGHSTRPSIPAHENLVNSVSFSPDGKMLVSSGKDGKTKLWNLNKSDSSRERQIGPVRGGPGLFQRVRFSPDGKILAVNNDTDGRIRLLSIIDGRELRSFEGNTVSFSPDGKMLAFGSEEGNIKLWTIDGEELATIRGHNSAVSSLSFSPDGKKLASSSYDGTIVLWNLDLDELLAQACDWARGYLATLDEKDSDRHLCDNIPR